MSFENSIPEPKQYYLNLLIKLDFIVADKLYIQHDWQGAVHGMAAIITQAMAWDVKDLEEEVKKIDAYADQDNAPIEELRPIHRKLKKYLNERWFSELHLGVIPTSTIAGDIARPTTNVFNPNQTSRL